MKIFQFFSFLLLLVQIQTQVNNNTINNNTSNEIKLQNNSVQTTQPINNPKNITIKKESKKIQTPEKNDTNKINNKENSAKINIQKDNKLNKTDKKQINIGINKNGTENKNNSDTKKVEDNKNKLKQGIIKEDKDKDKTKEEKPFNLTESLINFFKETFGKKDNETNTDSEEEKQRKKMEEEKQKKLIEERDRKRKEEQAKIEKIQMEEKKKQEKKEKQLNERLDFMKLLSNNSFDEVIQINLLKGEKEKLYMDLEGFTKIRIAIMVTDTEPEEKINFFFSGPNSRGRTAVIYQLYNKNYLFWNYETLRKGEFFAEIVNKGTKENEIYFLLNTEGEKKKDRLNPEKLDKISLLLNEIDSNVNQLRNKKKIEIKQVNSHNDKVNENNKWIIIYSIIEIFTMIMVFVIQSCYINSLVNKV